MEFKSNEELKNYLLNMGDELLDPQYLKQYSNIVNNIDKESIYKGNEIIDFLNLVNLYKKTKDLKIGLEFIREQRHSGGSYGCVYQLVHLFYPQLMPVVETL